MIKCPYRNSGIRSRLPCHLIIHKENSDICFCTTCEQYPEREESFPLGTLLGVAIAIALILSLTSRDRSEEINPPTPAAPDIQSNWEI